METIFVFFGGVIQCLMIFASTICSHGFFCFLCICPSSLMFVSLLVDDLA